MGENGGVVGLEGVSVILYVVAVLFTIVSLDNYDGGDVAKV